MLSMFSRCSIVSTAIAASFGVHSNFDVDRRNASRPPVKSKIKKLRSRKKAAARQKAKAKKMCR